LSLYVVDKGWRAKTSPPVYARKVWGNMLTDVSIKKLAPPQKRREFLTAR